MISASQAPRDRSRQGDVVSHHVKHVDHEEEEEFEEPEGEEEEDENEAEPGRILSVRPQTGRSQALS